MMPDLKEYAKMLEPWQSIASAPRDGTEVLVKDAEGNVSLVAFAPAGILGPNHLHVEVHEGCWHRRAEGDWDVYDSFGLQTIEAVAWAKVPA